MSAFDKSLRIGQAAEGIVAEWLMQRGYLITFTSQISAGVMQGPRANNLYSGENVVLPDLLASGNGATRWVEVKVKNKDAYHNITGEHRQGIDAHLFDEYLSCEAITGIEGWLAFIVMTPKPPKLRIATLEKLSKYKISMNGSRDAYRGKEIVFFNIDVFDEYTITDSELIKRLPIMQPPSVVHKWEKQAPKTTAHKQEYLF